MTPLQQANHALQRQDYASAIPLYVRALQQCVPLAPVLVGNLHRAQKAYRAQRAKQGAHQRPHVLVSSWDLSLNATGRAATLAQIWAGIGQAEVIGCLYPPKKTQLWAPLQDFPLPIHPLHVAPGQSFVAQALDFVLANPCDLLHLSKPRWPNIVLGLLYKLVWACPVWMDVDDEELAFAKADSPITLDEYLQTATYLPDTSDSVGSAASTRLGVGLANAFDGVTVVNPALQQRYGGSIVRHARDAAHFAPSAQRRQQARHKLGIAPTDTVIVFAGTPAPTRACWKPPGPSSSNSVTTCWRSSSSAAFRPASRHCKRKSALCPACAASCCPTKPLPICQTASPPATSACCCKTPAAWPPNTRRQPNSATPGHGPDRAGHPTPGLQDLAEQGAFIPVPPGQLPQALAKALAQHQQAFDRTPVSHPLFSQILSLRANQAMLHQLCKGMTASCKQPMNASLLELARKIPALSLLQSPVNI